MDLITLRIVVSLLVVILGTIAFLWVVTRAGDRSDPEYVKCQILCFVLVPLTVMAWLILNAFPELAAYVRSTIDRDRR